MHAIVDCKKDGWLSNTHNLFIEENPFRYNHGQIGHRSRYTNNDAGGYDGLYPKGVGDMYLFLDHTTEIAIGCFDHHRVFLNDVSTDQTMNSKFQVEQVLIIE